MSSTGRTLHFTRHQISRVCQTKKQYGLPYSIRHISHQLYGENANDNTKYSCSSYPFSQNYTKQMSSITSSRSSNNHESRKRLDGNETRTKSAGSKEPNVISCARIFSSLAAKEFTSTSSSQLHDSNSREENDVKKPTRTPNSSNIHKNISTSEIISLEELQILAGHKPIPLSLSDMFRYASADPSQRLLNAQFLHRELPTRLAQRTIDLLTLPHGLNKTRQVRNIAHKYLKYLHQLKVSPIPQNSQQENHFTQMLSSFVLDRSSIPMAIAAAVSSLKDKRREALDDRRLQEMEEALYRFFTSRVGLRFLTEHHILSQRSSHSEALRTRTLQQGGDAMGEFDFLGCIQKNCDPMLEVEKVVASVRLQCEECFGVAPEIELIDCTREKNKDNTFTYVPHHLRYMLAELLKNSCRATVRR